MSRYLRWYASLHKFYRILFWVAIGIGTLGVGVGLSTQTVPMVVLGVCWLVGGPAVIYIAGLRDTD